VVAVLAADLPAIGTATIGRLTAALAAGEAGGTEGAVLVDADGRRQYLIGVWRLDRLQAAIARRSDWHEQPLRRLLEPLHTAEIAALELETADVDTPQDWRQWQP
jgi:molybdopterin-guanine dinucleotide biosynthesis protein A